MTKSPHSTHLPGDSEGSSNTWNILTLDHLLQAACACLPKFTCGNANPQCDGTGGGGALGMNGFRGGHEGGALTVGLVPL